MERLLALQAFCKVTPIKETENFRAWLLFAEITGNHYARPSTLCPIQDD